MKLLFGFCALTALCLSTPSSLRAQTAPPITPEQRAKAEAKFLRRVQNATFGSCNATAKVKNAKERSRRCQCYSKAFIDKYSIGTLVAINNWSIKNKGNTSIVPIMMEPERKACNLPWLLNLWFLHKASLGAFLLTQFCRFIGNLWIVFDVASLEIQLSRFFKILDSAFVVSIFVQEKAYIF